MKKKKQFNKKGVTLIELLGYISLIGLALGLISNIVFQLLRNYDDINGHGALQNQANSILTLIMTSTNTFTPDFVRYCNESSTSCIELVKQDEIIIENGIPVLEGSEEIREFKITASGDLYIGDLKLNSGNYKLDYEKSSIQFECNHPGHYETCTEPIVTIDLWLYRINDDGEAITEPIQYLNKILFH